MEEGNVYEPQHWDDILAHFKSIFVVEGFMCDLNFEREGEGMNKGSLCTTCVVPHCYGCHAK